MLVTRNMGAICFGYFDMFGQDWWHADACFCWHNRPASLKGLVIPVALEDLDGHFLHTKSRCEN